MKLFLYSWTQSQGKPLTYAQVVSGGSGVGVGASLGTQRGEDPIWEKWCKPREMWKSGPWKEKVAETGRQKPHVSPQSQGLCAPTVRALSSLYLGL